MSLFSSFFRTIAVLITVGLIALPASAQTQAPVEAAPAAPLPPVVGTWRTLTGTEINVQPCGDKFCGVFSYIVIPASDAVICKNTPREQFAALILDYKNPNKALQSRQLLGLHALTLKTTGRDEYDANIYNAEEGKSYDVRIWINGNTLTLGGGCIASLCAVTQQWPRVPDRPSADYSCDGP